MTRRGPHPSVTGTAAWRLRLLRAVAFLAGFFVWAFLPLNVLQRGFGVMLMCAAVVAWIAVTDWRRK